MRVQSRRCDCVNETEREETGEQRNREGKKCALAVRAVTVRDYYSPRVYEAEQAEL